MQISSVAAAPQNPPIVASRNPLRSADRASSSALAPEIVEFPRTPAAPVQLPLTQIRVTEGYGTTGHPVTQVVTDLFAPGHGTDHTEMTTFHRGRMLANSEPALPTTRAARRASAAVFDALLGSDALRRGIDNQYRQVILTDNLVVKWVGTDGRVLATRVPIDRITRLAANPQDAGLVDAIRAWQDVTGVGRAAERQQWAASSNL